MSSVRINLFLTALGLSLFGAVMVYSATVRYYGTTYLLLHSVHIVVGLLVFLAASRVRYTAWRRLAPILYAAAAVTLVLVLIPGIGTEVHGSRRWLDLGFVGLQPSEIAKLAAVLVLSAALSRKRFLHGDTGLLAVLGPLAAIGLLFGLVVVEPDFGTSVVLLAGVAGTLWASELRTRGLVLAVGWALVALAAVMLAEPYRRERFFTFLDPWAVPEGAGYQTVQSMIAIRSGGLFGTGPGSGDLGASVPEVGTDMIFALVGQELGLPGMLAVIGAFCFLALLGFRISLSAPSVLGRCLAAGITTMFTAQAVFNIGAAMGSLPLAGMTLPFVSNGGSSIAISFAAIGILYRISEDSEKASGARTGSPRREPRGEQQNRRPEGRPTDLDRRRRYRRTRNPRAVRGG